MYHRDGDAILMTHYCAAQNQPRFRAEFDKETGDLLFVFSGGTNLDPKKDPHVHGGRVRFINANKVHSEWEFHVGGKKQGAHSLKLKRVK